VAARARREGDAPEQPERLVQAPDDGAAPPSDGFEGRGLHARRRPVSGLDPYEARPTWEQLINGVGAGVGVRVSSGRRSGPNPRHVRSWRPEGAEEWGLLDPAMPWREAWAWTALATACAFAAVRVAGMLR
jgi:hypothetical protein